MKNLFCTLIILFTLGVSYSYSQDSESTSSDSEILTPLVPEDQKPVGFSSQTEKEQLVPVKIEECKQIILDNSDDAEKVKYYREMLWRLENAIIIELSGTSN